MMGSCSIHFLPHDDSVTTVSEENRRLQKRLQIEASVIKLSGFGALLFSARILYPVVNPGRPGAHDPLIRGLPEGTRWVAAAEKGARQMSYQNTSNVLNLSRHAETKQFGLFFVYFVTNHPNLRPSGR